MENPKSRAWKVVKSEYLARKPWFTVRHERIELPDGRSIPDYYVFEYPDWVNVIAITKEGKFVFIDQYRHGGEWRELLVVAPNPATQSNLTYCYLATGVERLGAQRLDATEDIRVHLFTAAEVRELLTGGGIRQALMAAPLWRYAAEYGL